jgi:DNA-directed RNA polymerase II subunit RPB1
MKQFKEFENVMRECLKTDETEESGEDGDGKQQNQSKWIIRMEMNMEEMLDRNLTMDDIHFAIKNIYKEQVNCVFSDYNEDKLVFRIRMSQALKKKSKKYDPLDQQDEIYMLKNFQDELLDNLVLRGIQGLDKLIPRKITDTLVLEDGYYKRKETWVLDSVGTNLLDVLGLDYIDVYRSYTNDIQEIYRVLGIEAARQAIFNELSEVIEFDNTYINYHHLALLCDRMTCNDKMVSIFRHGINNDNIGPIAKASFEETPEMFLKAARHAELDTMRGISANVMCGQEGYFGTSAFNVVLDIDEMTKMKAKKEYEHEDINQMIEAGFEGLGSSTEDMCSVPNLTIPTHASAILPTNMGQMDAEYEMDF